MPGALETMGMRSVHSMHSCISKESATDVTDRSPARLKYNILSYMCHCYMHSNAWDIEDTVLQMVG